jgi:N6-L-threonylcarbamoyladenine synthase
MVRRSSERVGWRTRSCLAAESMLSRIRLALPVGRIHRIRRCFTVLGLESSADDTCAAVVTSDRRILSNVVSRQTALYVPLLCSTSTPTHARNRHAPYGGIEPIVAIQAHHDRMASMRAVKAGRDAESASARRRPAGFTRGKSHHERN